MIINQIGKKNDTSIPTPDVDADPGNIAIGKVGYDRTGKLVGTVPVKVDHKIMSYAYSEDGLPDIIDIGYFKGRYIVICKTNGEKDLYTEIAISKDGITWEKRRISGIVQKIYVGSNTVLLASGTSAWIYDGNKFTNISYSIGRFAFGDGIYMNMHTDGSIYTYEDSKSFTGAAKTSLNSDYTWKKICYGGCNGGVFVALPEKKNSATNNATSIIQYSLNAGSTWKSVSLTSYIYQDMCYGNGMFMLITHSTASNAEHVYYYTSYNGTSWSKRSLPVKGLWDKLFYVNGKFYVYAHTSATSITVNDKGIATIGSSGLSFGLYSVDGINWELITGRLSYGVSLVCDGVGNYIIAGSDEYSICNMLDDLSSRERYTIQLPDPDKTDDYLVLRTEDNKNLYMRNTIGEPTTVNAEVQKYVDTDTVTRVFGPIFYGDGLFILLPLYTITHGSSDSTFANMSYGAYSLDGIIWQRVTLSVACEYIAGCYGNGTYVAIGNCTDNTSGEVSATNKAAYSLNGINGWTSISLPVVQYWSDVCYGNGRFVAVAYAVKDNSTDNVCAAISYDGKTWTKVVQINVDLSFTYICYGNGKFVAIRDDACCYSDDGTTWYETPLSATKLRKITFGNGLFAIIGDNARVYYSTNLYDWEYTDTGANNAYNIVFGNGKFIVGNKYSYDCKMWKTYPGMKTPTANGHHVNSHSPACYGNGRFVRFGEYCIDKTEVLNSIPLSGGYVPV